MKGSGVRTNKGNCGGREMDRRREREVELEGVEAVWG